MTDAPALAPASSPPEEPDAEPALPRIAHVLRPHMETIAQQIVQQVRKSVPAYSGPDDTGRHQLLAQAANVAAEWFLDDAEQLPQEAQQVDDLFRRFGYDQARGGYSLKVLENSMRSASRWSWHYLAQFAIDQNLSRTDLRELAEAVFDYLDRLHDLLVEGYELADRLDDHDRDGARIQLFEMLLADPVPRPGTDTAPGIEEHVLRAAAELAEWPVPKRVAALAVSYYGEAPQIPESERRLIHVEPRRAFVVCPSTERLELAGRIGRSAPGVRVAVSWPVPPSEAGSGLRWCQRALDLIEIGVLRPKTVVRCEEHTTQLLLHAEPTMRRHLCQKLLEPLLAETPNSRAILSETLLTWVETHDSAPAIAARLAVHPQTVRYRWKRLNELFGESLQDPEFVVQILLVLKASLPLWKAGDQSDFDLFHDRADIP